MYFCMFGFLPESLLNPACDLEDLNVESIATCPNYNMNVS